MRPPAIKVPSYQGQQLSFQPFRAFNGVVNHSLRKAACEQVESRGKVIAFHTKEA